MAARSSVGCRSRRPRSRSFRLPPIARDYLLRSIVVALAEECDVDTLRQISVLLERENRLIVKSLQLTAELARLRGLPDVEQLTFVVEQTRQQARKAILDGATVSVPVPAPPRPPRPGHGPRAQPTMPVVELRHELSPDQRGCPACGGTLPVMELR